MTAQVARQMLTLLRAVAGRTMTSLLRVLEGKRVLNAHFQSVFARGNL